jgi:glycerophosphoryl diester phosphodiesterase
LAVQYQAHRGAIDEMPENTLPAFRHAWQFPGAIPETDVRTTSDGVLVCVHDATLERTGTGPAPLLTRPIAELTLEEVRGADVGSRFASKYAGLRVPMFEEVLAETGARPDRLLYVEPKAVDLHALQDMVNLHGLSARLLFVSGDPAMLDAIAARWPSAPRMTWIGGSAEQIASRLEWWAARGFAPVTQLQLHLDVSRSEPEIEYALPLDYLAAVHARLRDHGVDLQLRPFAVDATALRSLLGIGVRWFVTDAPQRFARALAEATGQI